MEFSPAGCSTVTIKTKGKKDYTTFVHVSQDTYPLTVLISQMYVIEHFNMSFYSQVINLPSVVYLK